MFLKFGPLVLSLVVAVLLNRFFSVLRGDFHISLNLVTISLGLNLLAKIRGLKLATGRISEVYI